MAFDPNVDLNTLTDEELKNQIGQLSQPGTLDPAAVNRALDDRLKSMGVNFYRPERFNEQYGHEGHAIIPGVLEKVKNALQTFILSAGRLPDAGEIRDYLNANGVNGQQVIGEPSFNNFLNDQENKNKFHDLYQSAVNPPNTKENITRLKDLISGRETMAKSQSAADQFTSSLPQELASGRDSFIQSQKDVGNQYFQNELAPTIVQNQNARGLLFSGDLASELASGYGGIQSGIEQQQADLQSQDDAFFFQAAYQDQLRKSIDAGQDVTSQIITDRNTALSNQDQNFKASQSSLNTQNSLDLLRRQQERALAAQQATIQRQNQLQAAATQRGLLGQLGTSGGAIGGAVIGSHFGPIGTAVGAGIGAGVGGGGSSLAP